MWFEFLFWKFLSWLSYWYLRLFQNASQKWFFGIHFSRFYKFLNINVAQWQSILVTYTILILNVNSSMDLTSLISMFSYLQLICIVLAQSRCLCVRSVWRCHHSSYFNIYTSGEIVSLSSDDKAIQHWSNHNDDNERNRMQLTEIVCRHFD